MRSRWTQSTLSAVAILAVAGGAASFLVWKQSRDQWIARELIEAERELADHHPSLALERFKRLTGGDSDRSDLLLLLGKIELARGKTSKALAAFARIPNGSPESGQASALRSRLEIQAGRLVEAEAILTAVLDDPLNPSNATGLPEARDALVRLLRSEGRFDEARRVHIGGYRQWSDPIAGLKTLYRLDVDPIATEGLRLYLANANRQQPDDDRAWLGLAALETRLGRFAEAEKWLDRCVTRRPGDRAVHAARLNWGMESDRPSVVLDAVKHLPADQVRAEAVREWFAAKRKDRVAEMESLKRRLKIEPGRPATFSRLAELAAQAGDLKAAAAYRAKVAELHNDRQRYESLLTANPINRRDAGELQSLAARLGLGFEAAIWSMVMNRSSDWPVVVPAEETGRRLADLLPELSGNAAVAAARNDPATAVREGVKFRDDAEAAGLRFVHENGASRDPSRLIPPVSGCGGVGLLDFDGDGRLDVYCVQSGPFPQGASGSDGNGEGDRLFRNKGDGTFDDVTIASGIAKLVRGYGHGVAVGDYDNDGDPDLFLTRWRSYLLLRNRGDGTFEDATERAGLSGDRDWPTSAGFADLDNDGDLELYVCHYFEWDENDQRTCADPGHPGTYHCTPLAFRARPDHLFRNDHGTFVDISKEAGITIADQNGRGLGVVLADIDGDHQTDVFVANDMSSNYFFKNRGNLQFDEVAMESGLSSNASGGFQAGMGTAAGDFDGDGRVDLFVTNFFGESTTYFHNLRDGLFADETSSIGLTALSRDLLGFGLALPDVDNDGRLDLLSVNGHIHDGRPQFPFKMPILLCLNGENGRLRKVEPRDAGELFEAEHLGRGLAIGDLDNDGKVDALVLSQNEPLVYLHNVSETPGHSIEITLEGVTSNRDGVGAEVTVKHGERRSVVQRIGGGSYQSANDGRIHVGLGDSKKVDAIEVRWPSGRIDRHTNLEVDRRYRIKENGTNPEPLADTPSTKTRGNNNEATRNR